MRSQKSKRLVICCSLLVTILLLLVPCYSSLAIASDKWQGIDESVVEKYAKEHGREAREPFINTDQGDLLLFVFLIAGSIGGFAAGYYWKELLDKNPKNQEVLKEERNS